MIGNRHLAELYEAVDEDTAFNQVMEMIISNDYEFIESLNKLVDISLCEAEELIFLTKVAAIIDYYLQIVGKVVPQWLRDEMLSFELSYYHSRRISDFEKIRLIYTCPAPFRSRNAYFDFDALTRV
jgi:hypothetical protein